MFDEIGLDYPRFHPAYPWSWQEFLTAAKKLTKREGNKVTHPLWLRTLYYKTKEEV